MRKTLFHVLLSFALIFQGMGVACASGMTMGDAGSAAQSASNLPMQADATSDACEGCPSCPDQQKHQHGSDCTPGCTVTSAVLPLRLGVPQALSPSPLVVTLEPSLIDFLKPPPTPPPIV